MELTEDKKWVQCLYFIIKNGGEISTKELSKLTFTPLNNLRPVLIYLEGRRVITSRFEFQPTLTKGGKYRIHTKMYKNTIWRFRNPNEMEFSRKILIDKGYHFDE